jgi:hypothetical protein
VGSIQSAVPYPREGSTQTAPRIREASVGDYPGIAAVLARNRLGVKPFDDWKNLWQENPAWKDRSWPIGWVLELADGGIVGTIGNVPAAYRLHGRDLLSASAGDWAVDEPYRRYSLALLDRLTKQPGVDLLLCSTVSPASEPAYPAFRWSRIPAGKWDSSDFWITNYTGFARAAAEMKALPLSGLIRYPAAAALFFADRAHSRAAERHDAAFEIEPCSTFDARFDEFWRELERENPDVLLGVRTREALRWHFRDLLRAGRAWIFSCSRRGRMVAYAIFDRLDSPALNLKRVRTIDFQALRGNEPAVRSLFLHALRKCRERGIDSLESPGCWLESAGVPRVPGVRRRGLPSWSFYYKATGKELAGELKDPNVWRPSLFDGDVTL